MTELDTTIGLSPDHYRANLLRGRILSLQGNPLGALDNLEKATRVRPIPGKPISSWPMPTSNSAAWPMRSGSGRRPEAGRFTPLKLRGDSRPGCPVEQGSTGHGVEGHGGSPGGNPITAWKGTTVAQAGTRSTAWKGTTSVVPHRAEASAALPLGFAFPRRFKPIPSARSLARAANPRR